MDFLVQIPLIVSYYTKNTPYEKEVEHLITSCEKFGIEHHVVGIEDRGSWEENCAYKPYFMRDKMKQLRRPLLWVDADAVFLKPLEFEDFMASDMSFYYEPALKDPRFSAFAGTVYVNASEGGLASLDLWCHYSDEIRKTSVKAPPYFDQAALHFAILSKPSFHFVNLPLAYAKIFDQPLADLKSQEVVIEHNQASRRFRKKVVTK